MSHVSFFVMRLIAMEPGTLVDNIYKYYNTTFINTTSVFVVVVIANHDRTDVEKKLLRHLSLLELFIF